MATRSKYSKIVTGYLSNYDLDCQVNFENMLDHLIKECKIKGETVKKHLHEFFLGNPNHLEKVKYYMPKSELIVSLTIQRLKENITEVNQNSANNIAGEVFNDFKHPLQKKLVREHWSPSHKADKRNSRGGCVYEWQRAFQAFQAIRHRYESLQHSGETSRLHPLKLVKRYALHAL